MGTDLAALPLEKLQSISPDIEGDVKRDQTPERSIAARDHIGGTAPAQVRAAAARARRRLAE
jgi:argininosuccinate lyase